MGVSPYWQQIILERTLLDSAVFPVGLFVSLHNSDPGTEGKGEMTGRGYKRQPVTFVAVGKQTVTNDNLMRYRDLAPMTLSHWGIWDAQYGGHYLIGGICMKSYQVEEGSGIDWEPAELVIRISD